ncbi:ERMES complex subunit [Malassezia yamatoensis]|uniref:Mitochondrial distribution and morphology protein 34 n=1 Tax=Malassezia yamatoensis TaxID=253288 RepID=A0AAJ6CFT3_9BASI|nr:ERMES complex subunit [Malassezia yamatoensis]
MSFNFSWPTFSGQFYEDAISTLNIALNRGPKPKVIAGDIQVNELHMGTVPPELEILEIGDLTRERFRGIFRLMYAGDAHIELSTQVQANPLAKPSAPRMGLFAAPAAQRGMLFAASPLIVPMRVKLSEMRLRAIVVLVVSRSKGVTLVFKNDPLESVRVSSTFDSVGVIQKYLQEEIEAQLREMFREDLPSIIHRLSQDWLRTNVPLAKEDRFSTGHSDAVSQYPPYTSTDISQDPFVTNHTQDQITRTPSQPSGLARLASAHSSHGLADLTIPFPSATSKVRTFHATSRVRTPELPPATPLRSRAEPTQSGMDVAGHLAELLRANHTLSPYTQQSRHVAIRSAPASRSGRSGRVHARQKRRFEL